MGGENYIMRSFMIALSSNITGMIKNRSMRCA